MFQDAQCLDCTKYFSDILSLNANDFVNAGATDSAVSSAIQQRIAGIAAEQGAFYIRILDAIVQFLGDKQRKICKTQPTDPNAVYFNCLNEYVMDVVGCKPGSSTSDVAKCAKVGKIIDEVMSKAVICSSVSCDDITKYPKIEERNICKATSQCKTLPELESNISKYVAETRTSIQSCISRMQDPSSDCTREFTRVIKTKIDAIKKMDNVVNEIGQASKLGSTAYGKDDNIFDIATMVIANN